LRRWASFLNRGADARDLLVTEPLIANLNFVDCRTGQSAGFSPRKAIGLCPRRGYFQYS